MIMKRNARTRCGHSGLEREKMAWKPGRGASGGGVEEEVSEVSSGLALVGTSA
jgi:hypothetical protein